MMEPSGVLLKEPDPPPGFEDFWRAALEESQSLPLEIAREHRGGEDTPAHRVERLRWLGVDGTARHGWYAVPHPPDDKSGNRLIGLLWLPGYGLGAVPINEYTAHPGMATLSINLHGSPPDHDPPYEPAHGYLTQGIQSPQTYIYRRIVMDCLRALAVLAKQPEVDSNKLVVAGMSQGGGLAILTAAWQPPVRAVIAEMPFMANWEYLLRHPALRYPIKEIKDYCHRNPALRAEVLKTLNYFDAVHHALYVRCPVQLSIGLKDPSIRVPVVLSLYEALTPPKRVVIYERHGHEWVIEMPNYLREWIAKWLDG